MPAIPAIIMGVAAIASSKIASSASNRATAAGTAANDDALAFERENEQRRQEEFDRTEAENRRNYDEAYAEDQRRWTDDTLSARRAEDARFRDEVRDVDIYNQTQERRQPYRDTSLAAVQDLASRIGLTVRPTTAPSLGRPTAPTYPSLAVPTRSMSELAR